MPKKALTAFAGLVAGAKAGRLTTALIRWFVGKYKVNMTEAANPNIASYASFNEFFTRALRSGARPLADADFICPCLLYTSPSPRDKRQSRMPSSA